MSQPQSVRFATRHWPSMFLVSLFLSFRSAQGYRNVLLIVSDDLRPELGAYGGFAKTPNLDAFASSPGTTQFDRAYVQQAICNPSRSSFLTGRRPDTTRVWDLHTNFRASALGGRNWTTLPQYFKERGFSPVAGMGKVFHPVRDPKTGEIDDVGYSWTEPYYHAHAKYGSNMSMCWTERGPEADESLFIDSMVADHAVETLRNISRQRREAAPSNTDSPFFVAVGLHRPHLPWDVPGKYYDLYPPATEIPLANVSTPPENWGDARTWAWDPQSGPRHCGPLGPLKGTETRLPEYGLVPKNLSQKFRRGYYAAVSQLDHNVGRVLRALEEEGFANETVVVFFGDHGWSLGDQGEFGKKTLFEYGTRIPLIIRDPQAAAEGRAPTRTSALVEAVDIFPTLVEVAGFDPPAVCKIGTEPLCVEGTSLAPLLRAPAGALHTFETTKTAAFSQYPHCMHDDFVWHDGCNNATEPKVMGFSVRVASWRYTEWGPFNKTTAKPTWFEGGNPLAVELYAHNGQGTNGIGAPQPGDDEKVNLATNPNATIAATIKELAQVLRAGWRAQQPQA